MLGIQTAARPRPLYPRVRDLTCCRWKDFHHSSRRTVCHPRFGYFFFLRQSVLPMTLIWRLEWLGLAHSSLAWSAEWKSFMLLPSSWWSIGDDGCLMFDGTRWQLWIRCYYLGSPSYTVIPIQSLYRDTLEWPAMTTENLLIFDDKHHFKSKSRRIDGK